MKKSFISILCIFFLFVLTACEEKKETSQKVNETNKQQVNNDKKETDISEKNKEKEIDDKVAKLSNWETVDGIGKMRQIGFGYNDELGIDGTDNPVKPYNFDDKVKLQIENLTLVQIKLDDKGAALFNSYQDQKVIMVKYKLINDSKDQLDFESENMKITLPNDEKINPERNLSDYYGIDKPIKAGETIEGVASFVLNDDNDVNKALLFVHGPMNMDVNKKNYSSHTFNFDILSVRDSVIKDIENK
ncbi:DUF5067 domain-containing protein [Heyndrickxia sporothermodurans]|uniref:DUF5067 domain-containing protein n=1 Tax=Heyndrickxia sporothermodurans TaxID=46224 RepID=UPI002DBB5808|nr:DUF5067 domain-containing protein [Heyndrickxia sporothermodurans]MEB6549128.1 DUF5067 domain-containing protein [Heyndrickxia sporothermodurans]MED3779350.1 DUF5067 domain-containing protein [Heyndrickxia sporothermodurans]